MHNRYKRNLIVLGFLALLWLASIPMCLAVNSDATCYGDDAILMLHMDGADTSTTFTDESPSSHTVTADGDAQVDTAQSKFGGASLLVDATGDWLDIADHADFDWGNNDFTIDFWVRYNAISGTKESTLYSKGNSAPNDGTVNLYTFPNYMSWRVFNQKTNAWTPSTATWYHVAVVRSGDNMYMFIDGTQIGSTQSIAGYSVSNTSEVRIGARNPESIGKFDGWIDEFRIVTNAIWTANFTAPSAAYTDCNATSFAPSMEII